MLRGRSNQSTTKKLTLLNVAKAKDLRILDAHMHIENTKILRVSLADPFSTRGSELALRTTRNDRITMVPVQVAEPLRSTTQDGWDRSDRCTLFPVCMGLLNLAG